MNISKNLDLAIKAQETDAVDNGYVVDGKSYNTYMTTSVWESFKKSMSPSALKEYGDGNGSELVEKNGRPPKMACYGSSSRMIYMLSRNTPGFHYEKKLATTVGGIANLDGFYEDNTRYIFVEAKCHEPYSAKNHTVSISYKKLYSFINEHMSCNIEIVMKPRKSGRDMDVEYFAAGEKIEYFDIKQMICHLLGVATGIFKKSFQQKKFDFIYLLYDPTKLALASDVKCVVDSIYDRTCFECNRIDFVTLFCVILKFLKAEFYKDILSDDAIEKIADQFTFALSSQNDYPALLQKTE